MTTTPDSKVVAIASIAAKLHSVMNIAWGKPVTKEELIETINRAFGT